MDEHKHHEHHEHKHHEHHAHKKETIKIKKQDLWKSATAVLAIVSVVLLVLLLNKGPSAAGPGITADQAADKAISYITDNQLVPPGTEVTLTSSSEKNGLYNLKLDIGGREFDSFVTKDGSLLFPSVVDMNEEVEVPEQQQPEPPADLEKSDKPEVEVFVMSHCPFGTQIMKGIIPVTEALGDTADIEIKFVNYAMHGEKEVYEQLDQYCIQEEQNDKFLPYLKCFLGTTSGSKEEAAQCMEEVDIDMDKLEACRESADEEFEITAKLEDKASWSGGRFPQFLIHNEENKAYGVRGSPTLVINGASVSSARDSVSLLNTICGAFNEAPEECKNDVTADNPSPGFGWEPSSGATGNAAAQCG